MFDSAKNMSVTAYGYVCHSALSAIHRGGVRPVFAFASARIVFVSVQSLAASQHFYTNFLRTTSAVPWCAP